MEPGLQLPSREDEASISRKDSLQRDKTPEGCAKMLQLHVKYEALAGGDFYSFRKYS
jgi:hypothetical protein